MEVKNERFSATYSISITGTASPSMASNNFLILSPSLDGRKAKSQKQSSLHPQCGGMLGK